MVVRIKDIANRLKISSSTVSRVLNNKGVDFISEATRQRVLKVAGELGYRPNRAARVLATGRTNLIGYWSPGIYQPFFASVENQMQQFLKNDGFEMLVRSVEWETGHAWSPRWPVDGTLAVCTSSKWVNESLEKNRLPRVPTVHVAIVQAVRDPAEKIDVVDINLQAGAREAVLHLVDMGCRRIAYLVSAVLNSPEEDRYKAYTSVMRESGMQPECIVVTEETYRAAHRELKEYILLQGCPDGIFCTNDIIAIGAYRGLRDVGIRIPDEVALVGCDGIEETEYLEVPISTIALPIKEMCRLAWQFLYRRIQNPSIPQQQAKLETRLVIRESSRKRSSCGEVERRPENQTAVKELGESGQPPGTFMETPKA